MALNGQVNSSKAKDSYLYCSWSATQNIGANSSTINWTAGIVVANGNKWYTNAVKITSVKINGTTVWTGGTYSDFKSNGTYAKKSGSIVVPHNADGTKSFKVEIAGSFYEYGNKSGSGTFTLNSIPRTSNITALLSTVGVGEIQTFNIETTSSSFTYTLNYKINNNTGIISEGISSGDFNWNIPLDIADNFPDSNSATLEVICQTYNGATLIGSTSTSFAVFLPSEYIPGFESPAIETSEYGSIPSAFSSITSQGKYIQNLSELYVQLHGKGIYNSSVVGYDVSIGENNYSVAGDFYSDIINSSGTVSILAHVKDSRNRVGLAQEEINVIPYGAPIINSIDYTQTDGSLKLKINGAVSPVENNNKTTLIVKYRPYGSGTYKTVTIYNQTSNYDINVSRTITDSDIDASTPYEIQVILQDAVFNSDSTATIKLVISNIPTHPMKTNRGYATFTLGGNICVNSYLSSMQELSWSNGTNVGAPVTFVDATQDKSLSITVGYTSDSKIIYSGIDILSAWHIQNTTDAIVGISTAFKKAICLGQDNIYWIHDDMTVHAKALPDNCAYISGTDVALYVITQSGEIYYLKNLDDNWKQVNISTAVMGIDDTKIGNTLKDIAPIYNAKFIATSDALVAIVNIESGWKIIRTPVISLR